MGLAALRKIGILNEVGQIGSRRKKLERDLDEKFGEAAWQLAHYVCGRVVSTETVCLLYEDAYYEFFRANPSELEWLVDHASDVYDRGVSDTASGVDYTKQMSDYFHIQDIAIRRVLQRLGRSFKGQSPLKVHSSDKESGKLSPGRIPFHQMPLINEFSDVKGWWDRGSVEDFYQKSKLLLVDPEKFSVRIAAISKDCAHICYKDSTYAVSDAGDLLLVKADRIPEESMRVEGSPELRYPFARVLLRKYFQSAGKRARMKTDFRTLEMELDGADITVHFALDELSESDPFNLKNAYDTNGQSPRRHYIGIIGDLVDAVIRNSASPTHCGCASGGNRVTRTYHAPGLHIVEHADFQKGSYAVTLKKDVPPQVYANLQELADVLRLTSHGRYKDVPQGDAFPVEGGTITSYVSCDGEVNLRFCLEPTGATSFSFDMSKCIEGAKVSRTSRD